MKLLLDTHAFIWWDGEPERLSARALALCEDSNNELVLSVASMWEIQIKLQLGKITLTTPLRQLVHAQQEANGVEVLAVRPEHVYELEALEPLHRDPFDRLLIAQARVERLRIVSHDAVMSRYPVEIEW